jgi:hypothetical protein
VRRWSSHRQEQQLLAEAADTVAVEAMSASAPAVDAAEEATATIYKSEFQMGKSGVCLTE